MRRQRITQLEILSGWKEIANYLGKGVRTVQRYELELGLPIRRPAGRAGGAVISTKAEIDAWVAASPLLLKGFGLSLDAVDNKETIKVLKQQLAELHRLRAESAQLRHEMIASQETLRTSIELLQRSVGPAERDVSSTDRMPDKLTFDPKGKVN